MKLGIMVLSIGAFGKKGFYNLQEIGLAKAMDIFCDEICVYKLVRETEKSRDERITGTKNAYIRYMPSKCIGTNGIPDTDLLDRGMDALICFSDTQVALPKVYHWAKKNEVQFFPYIGVIESHSTSSLKKMVINILFQRNTAVYRKCHCFVKTPAVKEELKKTGIKRVSVVPAGLDLTLLHTEYGCITISELKKKYGYCNADKVLLFVGRMIDEKQPLRMIDILSEIRNIDSSYKLLMIGTGELRSTVADRIQKLGMKDTVRLVESISNSDIWELYRIADAFVNLNQQEIFGMAILEAMYYGCKVVAWSAPGPNLIIENGKSGWLVNSNEEMLDKIVDRKEVGENAHNRVVNEFTWESSARKILSVIGE